MSDEPESPNNKEISGKDQNSENESPVNHNGTQEPQSYPANAESAQPYEENPKGPADQFGRRLRPKEMMENQPPTEPQNEIPPKRPKIDAITEFTYPNKKVFSSTENEKRILSPESDQIPRKIAQLLVIFASPSSRTQPKEIREKAKQIFTDYSKYTEILIDLFFEVLVRMSPQVESLAALFGYYFEEFYETFEQKLIEKLIPEILQKAFQQDLFRVVKLILRFLSAFVTYHLVTKESFLNLLNTLADKLESASPYRGEHLSRAILVACKSASKIFDQEEFEPVYEKVRSFINTRPKNFAEQFSPMKNTTKTFVDILEKSAPLPHFTDIYHSLFDKKDRSEAHSIPQIEFTFGEVDRAPFPFVVLQSIDEVVAEFDPVIVDIADDILVFFADDPDLASHQMLGLPMLLNYPTLKIDPNQQTDDPNSYFLITLFNAVIINDLLRIPEPNHPPCFHVSLFQNLIRLRSDGIIERSLSPIILNIVQDISLLDPGCYYRLVRFFTHYISLYRFSWCWDQWEGFTSLPENDLRLAYLKDVLSHTYYFGNAYWATNTKYIPEELRHLIPKPEISFNPDENSKTMCESLLKQTDNFHETFDKITKLVDDFVAHQMLIQNIYNLGGGDITKTIQQMVEFAPIIDQYFNEEWKEQVMISEAFKFFELMSPVLQELFVFLIMRKFIDVEVFLKFFFNIENKLVKKIQNWELFIIVMDSLVGNALARGRTNEAQNIVRFVYTNAAEFFIQKKNEAFDVVLERFIVGQLKEFGRHHYNIFQSIDAEMNVLIADANVDDDFKDIITTISLLGSF